LNIALVVEEKEPFVYGILKLPKGLPNRDPFIHLARNLIFATSIRSRITPHLKYL
jgi:hypothetical protein